MVVAAAAVVALIGGIAVVLAVIPRDDDGPGPTPPSPTELDPDDVAADYEALGSNVTAGAAECQPKEPVGSETDHVTCQLMDGQLELATYASSSDLTGEREDVVNFAAGTRYSEQASGIFFSHISGAGRGAVLYWDDVGANQSASVEADPGVKLALLHGWFRLADPASIELPVRPSDPDLIDFIEAWGGNSCRTRQTLVDGATELAYCTSGGGSAGYLNRFDTRSSFLDYRRGKVDELRANHDEANYPEGDVTLIEASGAALLWYDNTDYDRPNFYFDDASCLCTGYVWADDAAESSDTLTPDWGVSD